jgi:putative membrane protein
MKSMPPKLSHCAYRGWLLFFCGICMGAADLVPGISGGTIAFILGFYQPLLESLQTLNWSACQSLFKGNWRDFSQTVAWKFLLTLLAGIICAFICLANLFHFILSHEVYRIYLYATFLGLILASFVFCVRQIKVWKGNMIIGLCMGALVAYLLTDTTLAPASEGEFAVPIEINDQHVALRNYDSSQHLLTGLSSQTLSVLFAQGLLQDTTPVYNQQRVLVGLVGELVMPYRFSLFNGWLVMCGALAICALLLPGISGSYILTLLGVYPTVIESLVEFLNGLGRASFNLEAFSVLWSLGLGIVLGALAFARMLSWLLRHYPNQSLALLSGFMIGAIRSVWPFWSYEYVMLPLKLYKGPQLVALRPFLPPLDSPLVWQALLCATLAFVFVLALEAYVKKKRVSSS